MELPFQAYRWLLIRAWFLQAFWAKGLPPGVE
jgi:hypothetical protein